MIGHVLKLWLKKNHMSVTEFSSFSGYDRKVIYRWLNSQSIPTKKSLRNIVDTFAHYCHWTKTSTEFAYVELLNLRDKEYDFKKRRRARNK
jgi:transcriptional regulator with XRE-family HTH domain